MTSPFERLGISSTATPEEVKAAYHGKLREFPAHTYPEEFKAIRIAYDAIRNGEAGDANADFMKVRPLQVTLDPDLLKSLREKAIAQLEVTLNDLIQATF